MCIRACTCMCPVASSGPIKPLPAPSWVPVRCCRKRRVAFVPLWADGETSFTVSESVSPGSAGAGPTHAVPIRTCTETHRHTAVLTHRETCTPTHNTHPNYVNTHSCTYAPTRTMSIHLHNHTYKPHTYLHICTHKTLHIHTNHAHTHHTREHARAHICTHLHTHTRMMDSHLFETLCTGRGLPGDVPTGVKRPALPEM